MFFVQTGEPAFEVVCTPDFECGSAAVVQSDELLSCCLIDVKEFWRFVLRDNSHCALVGSEDKVSDVVEELWWKVVDTLGEVVHGWVEVD